MIPNMWNLWNLKLLIKSVSINEFAKFLKKRKTISNSKNLDNIYISSLAYLRTLDQKFWTFTFNDFELIVRWIFFVLFFSVFFESNCNEQVVVEY